MKKLSFLVSLITEDNDFQVEQAKAAEDTARRLNVDVRVIYAGGDAINQSQQLLKVIQSSSEAHPDGIIFEPAGGTALPHVAHASVMAGISWVVLNREADYLTELRRVSKVPAFSVSADHREIGRIQGQHVAALLPQGGTALYIQGPSTSSVARQRTTGMEQAKPKNVKLIMLKGQWTEESGYKSVSSWMHLSTSQKLPVDAVIAQNDDMAMGARKALRELTHAEAQEKFAVIPFTGCDGLPGTGQKYVRSNLLAATVVIPPNTVLAIEKMLQALQGGVMPPELVLTTPVSCPPLEELSSRRQNRTQPHGS
ncbi:MAG TPA: substrate-binding domain-containing protein [Candidatus Acidoferrales bacterium]|nr:substrate-binding domain-containing protein [Candidatus Acidoferrales bacterium]